MYRHYLYALVIGSCLWVSGCVALNDDGTIHGVSAPIVTRVAVGPDGRLVRIRATERAVLADASDDDGAHFGPAVRVSASYQQITARRDDPPALAVDAQGRIAVVYYAVSRRGVVAYINYAAPGGLRFGKPAALVAPRQATPAMVRLGAAPDGRTWLFWYVAREHTGGGTLFFGSALPTGRLTAPASKLADGLCECCRPALAFDAHGDPVLFARMIFPDNTRDHAMLQIQPPAVRRAVIDRWRIDACPMQGPALSIDGMNRYHLVWFTQGEKRRGLFYAYSDDAGRSFSEPLAVGNPAAHARRATVTSRAGKVAIAWLETEGDGTRLKAMLSDDRGQSWSGPREMAHATGSVDYPELLVSGERIVVSWSVAADGHRLLPLVDGP
jgi:hypothetical protein